MRSCFTGLSFQLRSLSLFHSAFLFPLSAMNVAFFSFPYTPLNTLSHSSKDPAVHQSSYSSELSFCSFEISSSPSSSSSEISSTLASISSSSSDVDEMMRRRFASLLGGAAFFLTPSRAAPSGADVQMVGTSFPLPKTVAQT